jgi:acryloyl-coenzyme A reductase
MKAIVVEAFGGPEALRLVERQTPTAGPGEALVQVAACGVCYHDVLDRGGRLPGVHLPRVLGHEIAGTVAALGPGVADRQVGERVVVYQRASCGTCRHCVDGRHDLCRTGGLLGSHVDGGYAEYVVVRAHNLIPLPPNVAFVDAALSVCPIATSLHAVRAVAAVGLGDVVLVTGASGGLGLHQIALARLAGADVIAVTTSEGKIAALRAAGAQEVVLAPDLHFSAAVWALTAKQGVNVVLDNVVTGTFGESMRSLGPDGRLVVLGNIAVASVDFNPGLAITRRLRILGSGNCTLREVREVVALLGRQRLRPAVDAVLPFPEAADAHRRVEARAVVGRVVLAGW